MRKVTQSILAALLATGVAVSIGCGSETPSGNDGGNNQDMNNTGDGGGQHPTVMITAPAAGSTVTAPVNVTWMATNWMGVPPMDPSCDNNSNNCGHVHLRIAPKANATADADFMVCNNAAMGVPYNNAGGMPLEAKFDLCTMQSPTGDYTIEIELRHNNHMPLSPAVKSAVNVKWMPGGGGTHPTVQITSPTPNMQFPAGTTMIPTTWMATNWMGVPPMDPSCDNNSNNCGHVHLRVAPIANATQDADFMACNNAAMGVPYNNAGGMPLNANLALCTTPSATGDYTIEIELRHNNHPPLVPAVKSSVNIKVGP